MDNGFTSLEEIKREFLIESNDIDEMVSALKGMLKELHPDPGGRGFQSSEDEDKFYKINEAIKFMREEETNEVAIRTEVSALAELVKMQLTINNSAMAKSELSDEVDKTLRSFRGYHRVSKLTLAGVSTFFGGLWLFPEKLMAHPIIIKYVDFSDSQMFNYFSITWILLVFLTLVLWLNTFKKDNKRKEFLEGIKSTSMQSYGFSLFLKYVKGSALTEEDIAFTEEEFIQFFISHGDELGYHLGLYDSQVCRIDSSLGESMAKTILTSAASKGMIKMVDSKEFSDRYRVI